MRHLLKPAVKTAGWYTKQAESRLQDIPQCALAYFFYQPGNLFPGDQDKLRIADDHSGWQKGTDFSPCSRPLTIFSVPGVLLVSSG
jgi:hypothetical protein